MAIMKAVEGATEDDGEVRFRGLRGLRILVEEHLIGIHGERMWSSNQPTLPLSENSTFSAGFDEYKTLCQNACPTNYIFQVSSGTLQGFYK